MGIDDEYFLVAAVKLAKSLGKTLSPNWIDLAVQRAQILDSRPGFRDETSRLLLAIDAWRLVRTQDFSSQPGFFRALRARWSWPGTKWIPKEG